MRAVVQRRYGPPDVLHLETVPSPAPGPREVRVEVRASAVTHGDRRIRAGDFPSFTRLLAPFFIGVRGPRRQVPGTTFAGRVESVGAAVTRFRPGDRVYGEVPAGAHAEALTIAEDAGIALAPASLTDAEAAALPYGGVTALRFLRDLGRVRRGERVCVIGATGGVGRFAVQIARASGADVTGVVRTGRREAALRLGCHQVTDAPAGPYDVIFDPVGALPFRRARTHLTKTGRYLCLDVSLPLLAGVLSSRLFGGPRAMAGVVMATAADLDALRGLVDDGAVSPLIDRVLPLERIAEAHARLESRAGLGAVVVAVDAPPAA